MQKLFCAWIIAIAAASSSAQQEEEMGKITVFLSSFAGPRVVFASADRKAVASWLIENGAYKFRGRLYDAGHDVVFPDRRIMTQGTDELDAWIAANAPGSSN